MTTAYTPILQLALPVTGELNGTWGTVVNDNITSMVEQAIAGLATINTWTAASHTLTTANGTTDEARCAVLECSGAPGAAATVVCPALSKLYVIKNSVTGGYAVTLKTSAGTGISVPNGSTALLYCDGTNVVSGATYMATLVTTSITDSGLTAGRVTYAGTGGLLQDAAALTFDGTTLSATKFAGALNGTVGATTPATVAATQVDITAQGDLRLQDTTGGEYVALQAPATIATSYTLTLPVDDGTAGQALITDGSGVLSWSSAASGDVYGPASATDKAIATYNGTTGKIIQDNSGVTITSNVITALGFTGPHNGTVGATTPSTGAFTTMSGTGQLTLTNASDYNLYASGAGKNYMAGSLGIGTTPYAGAQIHAGGTYPSVSALSLPFLADGVIPSTSTSLVQMFRSSPTTQAAAFTLNTLAHFQSVQGTLGAGSTINSQFGFVADSTLTGAANNYGFFGNIASGTGRYNFYAAGTADNYMAGKLGIGAVPTATVNLYLASNITGGTTALGFQHSGVVQSDVTTQAQGIVSTITTAASAFTLTDLRHFVAGNTTIGAGSAITNQTGFRCNALSGATNNYAFFASSAAATGSYNFYTASSAANVFAGTTSIGGTVGSESLRVTPVASAVNYWVAQGAVATGQPSLQPAGSDTNIGTSFQTKGTGSHAFYTNGLGSINFVVAHTASAVNYWQITGGDGSTTSPRLQAAGSSANITFQYLTKGTGEHNFYTNGAQQFNIANTTSAVNYLQVSGGATGGTPNILVTGSDTNVNFIVSTKGTGNHYFQTNSNGLNQFLVAHTASAVNLIQVTGGVTGVAPVLSVQGSDTNIDLALTPKGTGKITDQYGNIRAVPQSGAAKTSSYTLVTTDVGQYIQVSTSGAIVIPNSTFAAGDVISVFNNTSASATITCSTTNAYIAGTDTNKTSVTLATRGVATILFITSTLCVISGNVT